jgi:hypothetical protein
MEITENKLKETLIEQREEYQHYQNEQQRVSEPSGRKKQRVSTLSARTTQRVSALHRHHERRH